MQAILPIHPESNRELLKHSLIIYSRVFKKVFFLAFLLALVVFIPRFIIDFMGGYFKLKHFYGPSTFHPFRLALILANLCAILIYIAILWRIYGVLHARHEPLAEDFKVGLKKLFYGLIATVVQGFIITLLSVIILLIDYGLYKAHLLFVPGILGLIFTLIVFIGQFFLTLYVYTLFIFVLPIIALENKNALTAIRRSISLVFDHWWRTYILQILPWLSLVMLLMIMRYIFKIDVHIYLLGDNRPTLWVSILQLLLFTLFVPWVAALMLIQLHDLEMRKHIPQKDKNAIH